MIVIGASRGPSGDVQCDIHCTLCTSSDNTVRHTLYTLYIQLTIQCDIHCTLCTSTDNTVWQTLYTLYIQLTTQQTGKVRAGTLARLSPIVRAKITTVRQIFGLIMSRRPVVKHSDSKTKLILAFQPFIFCCKQYCFKEPPAQLLTPSLYQIIFVDNLGLFPCCQWRGWIGRGCNGLKGRHGGTSHETLLIQSPEEYGHFRRLD